MKIECLGLIIRFHKYCQRGQTEALVSAVREMSSQQG